jgi:hypothetical protein
MTKRSSFICLLFVNDTKNTVIGKFNDKKANEGQTMNEAREKFIVDDYI